MKNTNNTIEKPTIMIIEESKQMLIDTINKITLPMFLLEPIVKDIYNEISLQARNELEYSKIEYEKALVNLRAEESTEE